MKASRGVLLVALGLLAIVAIVDIARLGNALPWRQLYDFSDFYCAGAALDRGHDPYRYEPLHACEHAVNAGAAYRSDPRRVVPAPLPPYDLPPFMLVARSSFGMARTIGAAGIVLALVATLWGLSLLELPIDVAALALLLPGGYVLLNAGQVVPYALACLVLCGVALARGRDALAGVLAALTLIEPHLGLPVCAALLVWVARSRVALLATALALFAIGALVVGGTGIIEYVTRVLPAQAAAESGYAYQYSLTYLLRTLGVPAAPALLAGEISYAGALILAVWIGNRAAGSLGRRELLALLPGGCSVIAGAYVHMVDLAFALPATLVLAMALRGRAKAVATVALCLLAVPWIPVWITKKLFLVTLFVVAVLLLRLGARPALGVPVFLGIAATIYALELAPPPPLVAITPGPISPTDLAQDAWRQYVAALGAPSLGWLAVKFPTWAALGAMLAAAATALHNGESERA